jgi:hypothetical protein
MTTAHQRLDLGHLCQSYEAKKPRASRPKLPSETKRADSATRDEHEKRKVHTTSHHTVVRPTKLKKHINKNSKSHHHHEVWYDGGPRSRRCGSRGDDMLMLVLVSSRYVSLQF